MRRSLRRTLAVMDEDVARFGTQFQEFMARMSEVAGLARGSPVRDLLEGHLGPEAAQLPVVAESYASWDHVNVQVAMEAYLAGEDRHHRLVGLTGQQRRYGSLADLSEATHHFGMGIDLGSVDYVNLPIGPDDTRACVQFGLYLVDDRGSRSVVLMRGINEQFGHESVTLEVLGTDREASREFLGEIRRLMAKLNVFRRQLISFGEAPMGHMGVGPITFLPRPEVARDGLVLAPGVLEAIERQIFAVAEHRDRLSAAGQHVKRGMLLHGPPGTGKTLTVRYLVSRLSEHTVIVLTGGALGAIRPASALARHLAPSVVVLEDVDLIAEHRRIHVGNSPVLFDLLNEMDGIAEDTDVAFLLTTNRADLLEPALAARPGRVDLAVEIALPDADARGRLIDLYGRGLDLQIADGSVVVERTEGVTPSFIKELMRKAALLAAIESGDGDGLAVGDGHIHAALDELMAEGSALTRALLGGAPSAAEERRPGTEWMLVEDPD